MNEEDDLIPPQDFVVSQGIGAGDFAAIGDGMVGRLRSKGLVPENGVVLDIGCGLGRVARPLTKMLSPRARYYGFDINRKSIEWCRARYARFLNFHFDWLNLHSVYYNTGGDSKASEFRFPLRDDCADTAVLTSVFTHMFFDDTRNYLMEVARMLKPGGTCFITYFLVDESLEAWYADAAAKGTYHRIRHGYVQDKNRPEAVVCLEEKAILSLYAEAGLDIQSRAYGTWAEKVSPGRGKHIYQDEVFATKRH